jgi:biopolymer transport protein ExbD
MCRRARTEGRTENQLTSMIDVVFLLLIFFITTMSFRVIEGRLDTQLPKDKGGNPGEVVDLLEPLDVHVELDPTEPEGFAVRCFGRRTPLERLASQVAGFDAASPDAGVRLSAGPGVEHGQVVEVLDEILQGGAEKVVFAG